jgi:hypothetical protein
MRYQLFRKWRFAGLSSLFLFGCESGSGRHSYPDDPLLLDKKPVECKVENASPPALVQGEPTPPAMPPMAVPPVSESPSTNVAGEVPRHGLVPAQPARSAGKGLVAAVPASRSRNLPETDPGPPIRRLVPETFGHAADFSWLQGVLSKPPQGPAVVRYHENPAGDKWRGQVELESDPRLALFHDGDLVLVEGEFMPMPGDGLPARFRIGSVWLVRRDR